MTRRVALCLVLRDDNTRVSTPGTYASAIGNLEAPEQMSEADRSCEDAA
jgi:hypothetical protein